MLANSFIKVLTIDNFYYYQFLLELLIKERQKAFKTKKKNVQPRKNLVLKRKAL